MQRKILFQYIFAVIGKNIKYDLKKCNYKPIISCQCCQSNSNILLKTCKIIKQTDMQRDLRMMSVVGITTDYPPLSLITLKAVSELIAETEDINHL